jgi:hypothetical protein
MAGTCCAAFAATVQTRAGGSSEREWVSDEPEESPRRLTRPLRTKSRNVSSPRALRRRGARGRGGMPDRRRKLPSLCPPPVEPVEPVNASKPVRTDRRASALQKTAVGALYTSPESWRFAARRCGGKGDAGGQEAAKSRATTRSLKPVLTRLPSKGHLGVLYR